MKHVFVVGSHTQYLTSMGTILSLKLSEEEVVFIWGRHYRCRYHDPKYVGHDLSDTYVIYFRHNTKRNLNDTISKIDAFIDNKIKEDYTLYVSHLQFPFSQIMATNRKCVDVKFIQEGIIDFCSPQKETIYDWLINVLILRSDRVWKSSKWNTSFRLENKEISETFAISDCMFKDINCKHSIVKWPAYDLNIELNAGNPIFLFESAVEMGLVDKKLFMTKTELMIEKYARAENYVKFHPFQSAKNKKEIIGIFNKFSKGVKELPEDIPFELILSSQQHLTLYGFSTSLLFFGRLAGHNATICGDSLLKSGKFRKYWRIFRRQLGIYGNNSFTFETI